MALAAASLLPELLHHPVGHSPEVRFQDERGRWGCRLQGSFDGLQISAMGMEQPPEARQGMVRFEPIPDRRRVAVFSPVSHPLPVARGHVRFL